MAANSDSLLRPKASVVVETDMREFESTIDDEFCHFGRKGSPVMGCGIPRSECTHANHRGRLRAHGFGPDARSAACSECGRPWCPRCAALYWELWG